MADEKREEEQTQGVEGTGDGTSIDRTLAAADLANEEALAAEAEEEADDSEG